MARCTSTRFAAAPPETVWEALADHLGMKRWLPVRTVKLEHAGDPPPNGVGAIRLLTIPGVKIREQVTLFEPPRRLAYKMLSGAPVRDYHAEVLLARVPNGTDITWTVAFQPRFPGVQILVRRAVPTLTKGLAREAERRARLSG